MLRRWAWTESQNTLALGDATAHGVMLGQVYAPSLAVAERDRLIQVAGLDLGRGGVLRATSTPLVLQWDEVGHYSEDESDGRPAVALTLTRAATARSGIAWLIVVQNLDQWRTALATVGIGRA